MRATLLLTMGATWLTMTACAEAPASAAATEEQATPDQVDGAAYAAFYTRSITAPADLVYDAVYHALEENRFYVIAEPNIGKSLARNAQRWGEDYNRNGLESIRSMVFCSPWYANQLSNVAPPLLGLCPFSVTLLHLRGDTTITFERPTAVVTTGPARELVAELEAGVVGALEGALDELADAAD